MLVAECLEARLLKEWMALHLIDGWRRLQHGGRASTIPLVVWVCDWRDFMIKSIYQILQLPARKIRNAQVANPSFGRKAL